MRLDSLLQGYENMNRKDAEEELRNYLVHERDFIDTALDYIVRMNSEKEVEIYEINMLSNNNSKKLVKEEEEFEQYDLKEDEIIDIVERYKIF